MPSNSGNGTCSRSGGTKARPMCQAGGLLGNRLLRSRSRGSYPGEPQSGRGDAEPTSDPGHPLDVSLRHCTAQDLQEGYRGFTRPLFQAGSVHNLTDPSLRAGDLPGGGKRLARDSTIWGVTNGSRLTLATRFFSWTQGRRTHG